MDGLNSDWSFLTLIAQDPEGGGGPASWLLSGPMIPFLMIGVLFYMLLIRPERRKRAAMNQLLENLKKNDRVVTIGGIHGVVVNVQKGAEDVSIRVDEGVRLRVLRSAISRVLSDDEGSDKKDA